MHHKTRIRSRDLIRDIRSGKTASELMGKYRISSKGLRSAFRKLLNRGAITQGELDARLNLYGVAAGATGLRKVPRKRISKCLWAYDACDPFEASPIRDISEKGVCIDGIRTKIGETKTFMVRLGVLERHSTFIFEAKCRWTGGEAEHDGELIAGFEITSISPGDLRVLQKALQRGYDT